MSFKKTVLCLLAGGALLLAGCSQQQAQPPATGGGGGGDTTAAVTIDKNSAGYKVFAQSCASCHGADLQGQVGPNLQHAASFGKDRIQTQILNGGGGMPAFKGTLSDQNVQDLVNFLSSLK